MYCPDMLEAHTMAILSIFDPETWRRSLPFRTPAAATARETLPVEATQSVFDPMVWRRLVETPEKQVVRKVRQPVAL